MLNVFGDEEDKFLGYTMSTVNPLTSIIPFKICIVETGRLSNCRLHPKSGGSGNVYLSIQIYQLH